MSVEVLPVSQEDMQLGLLAAYECRNEEGDVVRVLVRRAKRISPDQMAAVFEPIRSGRFRLFRGKHFLCDIETSLIAHGALPIRRRRDDKV